MQATITPGKKPKQASRNLTQEIEPKWVHGKRAVSEPDRLLSAAEIEARVYAYYRCEHEEPLIMPKKVA